jgi:TatD DNase family protein
MLINIHTHHYIGEGIEIVNSPEIPTPYYSYGIAPFEANEKVVNVNSYTEKSCVFIGEIGLDKNTETNINQQIESFKNQLNIALKLNKPVIIHCVKAFNELINIKKEFKEIKTWIIHGFRKTTLTQQLIQEGFYLSIGTAILYDTKLQESLKTIPSNRLFLETDNDKRHTIKEVYEKVALIKGISLVDLELLILKNFKSIINNE